MKTLSKLIILNLIGLYISQDVEFFNCPSVPRVPDFTYRDLSALSVAILYNSTEDIETFLNSGCGINDGRECRTEVVYAGYAPLNLAVLHGNIDTVNRLLRVP